MTSVSDLLSHGALASTLRQVSRLEQDALRYRGLMDVPIPAQEAALLSRSWSGRGILDNTAFAAIEAVNSLIGSSALAGAEVRSAVLEQQRSLRPTFEAVALASMRAATPTLTAGFAAQTAATLSAARGLAHVGQIQGIVAAQTKWLASFSAGLESTSVRALVASLSPTVNYATLGSQFEAALKIAALRFPTTFDEVEDYLPEVAHAITEKLSHASESETQGAGQSVRGLLMEVLAHKNLLDAEGRANVGLTIAVILLTFWIAGGGEIAGSEWNRWRDAPARAQAKADQAEQAAFNRRMDAQLASILELVAHPPRQAVVVRRAWLREAPNKSAKRVGEVMDAGTTLIVYERADGWVRVEVELTPGDMREGWVYGKLTRYQ